MNRTSEVLEQLRRAEAAAREEVERLLEPAGLAVIEIHSDGDGWRLRVARRDPMVRSAAGGSDAARPRALRSPVALPTERRAASLVRQPGETLMALVSRAGVRLPVLHAQGRGGVCVAPATDRERVVWLAGTLVGDTVLGLRHLGEPEDGERALQELHRQLGVFLRESRRLVRSDDPGPFLEAVDRWTPAGFPRGQAFLARGKGVAHA